MIRHYLTVGVRNFRRRPIATGINVLALTLGLACFIVAYAVVSYWDHAERQFPKANRTYVITESMILRDAGVSTGIIPFSVYFAAKYIKADFPEAETVARARPGGVQTMSAGDKKVRLPLAYADPEFLDVFDLPFVRGDTKTAFSGPNSVILSADAATQFFGSPDLAMGKSFVVAGTADATVTGVIGPIAQPSHIGASKSAAIQFDVLASWNIFERFQDIARKAAAELAPDQPAEPEIENWLGNFQTATYVVLPEDGSVDAAMLTARLKDFAIRRVPAGMRDIAKLEFGAIPVTDIMPNLLSAALFARTAPGLSVTTLLFVLGGLVLAVAGLNYANLATAQTFARAKEVGMRKVVGASRGQVTFQYVFEAGILTLIATILALGVIEILSPAFKAAADIDLPLGLFDGIGFWAFLVALIIVVSVLAGAYPALILSRVRPMQALRSGRIRTGPRFLPGFLVGAQFCTASVLLIAVIVMYSQNRELEQSGLGVDNDPLVIITNPSQFTKVKPGALRSALEQIPQVKAVTGTSLLPWDIRSTSLNILSRRQEEGSPEYTVFETRVDYDYFSALGISTLAGRVFDRAHGGEVMRGYDIQNGAGLTAVIDQALVTQLGFASPQAAVDQTIYLPARLARAFGGKSAVPVRIVGVVENKALHFIGLGATSTLYFLTDIPNFQIVRVSRADVTGARAAIQAAWDRLAPDAALDMTFMDTLFEQNYELFGTVNRLFGGLALFAFVISTIGLFGMAIQVTGRRTREIGVRKTLGASTRQIIAMLLRDFSKPVVIANLVAWPLGFLAAQVYLSVFVHRISLTPVPFVLSLMITLIIAWAAVGAQAFRAARVKPATVLRYE